MTKRTYSLFERKTGEKKWTCMFPKLAWSKHKAIRMFQNLLLDAAVGNVQGVERSLRVHTPVNEEYRT